MYATILTPLLPLTLLLLHGIHKTQAALCSGIVKETATSEHQILRSPNYPDGYYNNELCRWEVDVKNPEYEVVRFNIQNTYIRNSATCGEDYVEVRDGLTPWSRLIRRWCGEKSYEDPVTSTFAGVFITFRSNGQFNDKGFELEFWSVPKSIIEVQIVELKLVNYILFISFGIIFVSISLGLVVIILARIGIKKQLAKEAEEAQKFAIHVENNGVTTNGTMSTTHKADLNKTDLDEKARKRDSANNGSTTRVIKLEPALGSGLLKETSTTPV